MRILRAVFSIAIAFHSFASANAEDKPDNLDFEMSVAYCLSYKVGLRNWVASFPRANIPAIDSSTDKALAAEDAEIVRLRTYLYAHGIGVTVAKDPTPYALASERGKQDAKSCSTQAEVNNSCTTKCSKSCDPRPGFSGDKCTECIMSCEKPAACVRGARCTEVEAKLPF
jgi:hypothetical protein